MSTTPTPLTLHAYGGRENGLMIIGDREALCELGRQLQSPAAEEAESAKLDWPRVVAQPDVTGPYKGVSDYKLTFHVLESKQLPASLISPTRRGPHALIRLTVAALAIVGAATILRWVL